MCAASPDTHDAAAANKAVKLYKVKGAANSEHSIGEEERAAFATHINLVLRDDKFLGRCEKCKLSITGRG